MVRHYVRKTNNGNWSETNMKMAIEAVEKKELSIRKAANVYNIPKDTIHRRLKGMLKNLPDGKKELNKLGRYRSVLSPKQEKDLADYILKMDEAFYGLSIQDVRRVVFEYAEKNGIAHPFNSENKMAGRDFVKGFLQRNQNLSLRKPEAVSLNRVFGLNKTSVVRYFNNLETVMEKYNFQPHQIFNCDESGLTCVHKPLKVIAPTGKRVVASATSGERGVTTTIIVTYSASGRYIPPMMIFKRKRMKDELIDHAPPGTIGRCSDSGWIETELFMDYIKHFAKETKCSQSSPVLLILDGHKTHTKNLELVEYARDNGIVIVSLPPHTSHKLQPLDRTFFKPLKCAYNAACSSWLRQHPARRITVDKIGELFTTAYTKAATMECAISGFRCTGIVPLNRNILPESEFLLDPRETSSTVADNASNTQILVTSTTTATTTVTTSLNPVSLPTPVPSTLPPILSSLTTPLLTPLSPTLEKEQDVSTSSSVSFNDILKVPIIIEKVKSKRSEESQIITSSPYKRSLQSSIEKQQAKKIKPANKGKSKKPKSKLKEKVVKQDWQCLICTGMYSESKPGEEWVACAQCKLWFHDDCCTSLSSSGTICDFCL